MLRICDHKSVTQQLFAKIAKGIEIPAYRTATEQF